MKRFQEGYGAAQIENPMLHWADYLKSHGASIGDIMGSMSPDQRGISNAPYVGRVRWTPRS